MAGRRILALGAGSAALIMAGWVGSSMAATTEPIPESTAGEPAAGFVVVEPVVASGAQVSLTSTVPCNADVYDSARVSWSPLGLSAESENEFAEFDLDLNGDWNGSFIVAEDASPGLYSLSRECVQTNIVERRSKLRPVATVGLYVIGNPFVVDLLGDDTSITDFEETFRVTKSTDCEQANAYLDTVGPEFLIGSVAAVDPNAGFDMPVTFGPGTQSGDHQVIVECSIPSYDLYGVASSSVDIVLDLSVPVTTTSPVTPTPTTSPASTTAPATTTPSPTSESVGATTTAATTDVVLPAAAAALPSPWQLVPGDLARDVLVSFGLAVLAVLLVGFPAELFNKTVAANRSEIDSWFRRLPLRLPRLPRPVELMALLICGSALLTATAYDLRYAGYPPEQTAYVFTATVVAILVTTILYEGPLEIALRLALGGSARAHAVPFAVVVALLLGLLSLIGRFIPGYLYGLFITMQDKSRPSADDRTSGRSVLVGVGSLMAGTLVLWFLSSPEGAPVLVDTVLDYVVIMGVQSAVFILVPLYFLDGHQLFRWRKWVWGPTFGAACFAFFLLMVVSSIDVGLTTDQRGDALVTSMALFLVFGTASTGFWWWFRVWGRAAQSQRI